MSSRISISYISPSLSPAISHQPSLRDIPTYKLDFEKPQHQTPNPKYHSNTLSPDITFLKYTYLYLKKSIPLSLMRALPFFQSVLFYIFIGWYNNKQLLAGYGLALSSNAFFNAVLTINAAECTGIYASKYFGAKQYKDMRLVYYRGIGISF